MRAILIEKGREPVIIPDLRKTSAEEFAEENTDMKLTLAIVEPTDEEFDEGYLDSDDFENWLIFFEYASQESVYDLLDNTVLIG